MSFNFNFVDMLVLLPIVVTAVSVGVTLFQQYEVKKQSEMEESLQRYKLMILLKQTDKIEELQELYASSKFNSSVARAADFTFNHKAYDLVMSEVKKKERGEEHTFAFTSLIVKHTSKANTITYFYLILSFLLYLILTYSGLSKETRLIPILILIIAVIVFVRQRILVYRIKKGLYGSNEHELREILQFVLDEKNKHHFGGKGGKTPVFDINNLEELENTIKDYQLEGVKA